GGVSTGRERTAVARGWRGPDYKLGAPLGRYSCPDPAAGPPPTTNCPPAGKIYGRDWQYGRVLVNPTAATTVTVSLGESLLDPNGARVTSVRLAPGSGTVLQR